jgi:hypothetical protein
MSEGIEIHYNNKRQYLELACEPNAFALYRKIAKDHLSDFPEINVDEVIELNIVDMASFVANRDVPMKRFWETIVIGVMFLVLALAVIGAVAIIRWIAP